MKSIEIPDSVTTIDTFVFSECASLTSVALGSSVEWIDSYAFGGCTSLTGIKYNGTIEQWYAITKSGNWNSGTGNYTIHCTDGDISKYYY